MPRKYSRDLTCREIHTIATIFNPPTVTPVQKKSHDFFRVSPDIRTFLPLLAHAVSTFSPCYVSCASLFNPQYKPLPLLPQPHPVSANHFEGLILYFLSGGFFSFSKFTPSSSPPVRPGSPRPEPPLCRRSPPCRSKSPGKYFNLLSSVSHKAQK